MPHKTMPKPKSVEPISRKRCTIIGCTKWRYGKGMCMMHWSRWRRHRDPNIVLHLINPTPMERRSAFFKRIKKVNGCWIWLGTIQTRGYGKFGDEYAHRYAYEAFVGKIPKELQIDHLCRNRDCVNPAHMELVTPLENWRRGKAPSAINSRRTHCKNGHAFVPENTLIYKNTRTCRVCRNRKRALWRAKFGREKKKV